MLYALAPTFAAMGSLFVLGFGIILSMYGGGFSTVPAYLADMFGTTVRGCDSRPAADGVVDRGHRSPAMGRLEDAGERHQDPLIRKVNDLITKANDASAAQN